MMKKSLLLLRLLIGWLMFYAGMTKILDSSWTAAGYLENASYGPFRGFYQVFANNSLVDSMVKYGLTLIGISLLTGTLVMFSSFWGLVMMMLFYFATFPPEHGIVDEHIIYAAVFLLFMAGKAGMTYGLDSRLVKNKFFSRNKRLKSLLI